MRRNLLMRIVCMLKGHDKVFLPEEQFRELTIRLRTEFDEVPWASDLLH